MAAQVIVCGGSLLHCRRARLEAKREYKLTNVTPPCAARPLHTQTREWIHCMSAHEMQRGCNIGPGGRSRLKHSRGLAETASGDADAHVT